MGIVARPLDVGTVMESVARTNRLLVVEEGPRTGGWGGELLARVAEESLEALDDAWRLAAPDLPLPYSPPLEAAALPSGNAIVQTIESRPGII